MQQSSKNKSPAQQPRPTVLAASLDFTSIIENFLSTKLSTDNSITEADAVEPLQVFFYVVQNLSSNKQGLEEVEQSLQQYLSKFIDNGVHVISLSLVNCIFNCLFEFERRRFRK